MRLLRQIALLFGITLLAAQTAQATTLLQGFSDLPSWLAAVTASADDTFDSLTAGSTYSTSSGYTDAYGIEFIGTFDSAGYSLEVVGPSLNQAYNFGSGNSLYSGMSLSNRSPILMVNLPANVTAIGLDVMTTGNVYPVTITVGDAVTQASVTVSTAQGQQTFYGFTFSAPVTWLKASIPGAPSYTNVLLDNFQIGAVDLVSTPEPATFLLIGLGLICMACLRKRRPA